MQKRGNYELQSSLDVTECFFFPISNVSCFVLNDVDKVFKG